MEHRKTSVVGLICAVAALLAAAAALAVSLKTLSLAQAQSAQAQPQPTGTAPSAEAQLLSERLAQITGLVQDRQIVPQDYLRGLDEDLASAVTDYNTATQALSLIYTQQAIHVLDGVFFEFADTENTDSSYGPELYQRSDFYYECVGRFAHYALFQNAADLFYADPYLCYPLAQEAGGSYGLWASLIHEDFSEDGERGKMTQDYFDQVDALLSRLDAARIAAN